MCGSTEYYVYRFQVTNGIVLVSPWTDVNCAMLPIPSSRLNMSIPGRQRTYLFYLLSVRMDSNYVDPPKLFLFNRDHQSTMRHGPYFVSGCASPGVSAFPPFFPTRYDLLLLSPHEDGP